MSESLWYYEDGGKQAGPIGAEALAEAIRSGRLARGMRVWRAGMATWQAWEAVPELAALAAPPQAAPSAPIPWSAPGAAPPPSPAAGQPGWGPAPLQTTLPPGTIEPVGVPLTILLSVVTLGIYGLVKFHQCGTAYARLSPARPSAFERFFWIYLGLSLGSVVANLVFGPLAIAVVIASFVAGIFVLNEVLAARDAAQLATGARVVLTSATTHKVLWIGGTLLTMVGVGLLVLLVQAVLFFQDHDHLAAALGRR